MSAELINLTMSAVAVVVSLVAYRAAVHQNRLSASSVAADWLRDVRLSALIDRGRFFLPNQRDEEYGSHKPRA